MRFQGWSKEDAQLEVPDQEQAAGQHFTGIVSLGLAVFHWNWL